MLGHASLYRFLAGRGSRSAPTLLGVKLSEQLIVSAAGNAIASFATLTLGTSIGIAFVQIFWVRLRRRPHTIQQIEAMLSCRTSPFSLAALRAWRAAWMLSFFALLGSAMRLVTIFAPGSLRMEVLTTPTVCAIPQADFTKGNFSIEWPNENGEPTQTPAPELWRMAVQTLVSGTYVPPSSGCETCQYNTTFNAPALICTNITSQYNFTSMFQEETPFIWNATVNWDAYTMTVATIGGNNSEMEAVNCSVQNATYSIRTSHTNTSTAVEITNKTLYQSMNDMDQGASDYISTHTTASVALGVLEGLVQVDMRKMQNLISTSNPLAYNPYIIFSALGQPGPPSSLKWVWSRSMLDALPELMANISTSLLSNPINAPVKMMDRDCEQSSVAYTYSPSHLYAAYGSGLFVSTMCVAAGFWSIRNNEREETIDFSRLLVAILSPRMLNEEIKSDTRLAVHQEGPNSCTKFSVASNNFGR